MKYRLIFIKPFYFLQEKGRFLWIFPWWNTLEFSQDFSYIEELFNLKIKNEYTN